MVVRRGRGSPVPRGWATILRILLVPQILLVLRILLLLAVAVERRGSGGGCGGCSGGVRFRQLSGCIFLFIFAVHHDFVLGAGLVFRESFECLGQVVPMFSQPGKHVTGRRIDQQPKVSEYGSC